MNATTRLRKRLDAAGAWWPEARRRLLDAVRRLRQDRGPAAIAAALEAEAQVAAEREDRLRRVRQLHGEGLRAREIADRLRTPEAEVYGALLRRRAGPESRG
jgi:DNA-directed RNA polymerase specialized sigma24 family protein